MNWMRVNDPPRMIGHGLGRQRLGQARRALQQAVAAGEPAHEQPLEHAVLADEDALGLEQGSLQGLLLRGQVGGTIGGGGHGGAACAVHLRGALRVR